MFLVLFLLFPVMVHAYLDLGSGSFFLQMLLALFFTVLVSVRAFWYKIFSFFRDEEKKEDDEKNIDEQKH
jgi:hypothetical protein